MPVSVSVYPPRTRTGTTALHIQYVDPNPDLILGFCGFDVNDGKMCGVNSERRRGKLPEMGRVWERICGLLTFGHHRLFFSAIIRCSFL